MTGRLLLFFPICDTKNTIEIVLKKTLLIQKCFFVSRYFFSKRFEYPGRGYTRAVNGTMHSSEAI
jgi:hypothetical protein